MPNIAEYRITKNVEASIVDWLTEELKDSGWVCRVELDFSEAYKSSLPLPCIVINADNNSDTRLEVGGNQLSNLFDIEFRIFATGESQRKDLRDWLRDKVMNVDKDSPISYYEYVINNDTDQVESKDEAGRISIIKILINRKELRNTDNIDSRDRSRHLLSFSVRIILT